MSPRKRQRQGREPDQEAGLNVGFGDCVSRVLQRVDGGLGRAPADSLATNKNGRLEQDEAAPSDYEREIARVDAGTRSNR